MLNEIYIGFGNILTANEPIRFANTYFSMPVSYSGKVIKVGEGRVVCQAPKVQLICMRRDRFTYVRSNLLPYVYKAHVDLINWQQGTVDLINFERTSSSIGNRSLVRVEPRRPVVGLLIPDNEMATYQATITEISIKGLGMVIGARSYNEIDLAKGKKVFIVFELPLKSASKEEMAVSYKGVIRNVTSLGGGMQYRIGVQVYPTVPTERILTRYLAQRQAELLKEIRRLSKEEPLIL